MKKEGTASELQRRQDNPVSTEGHKKLWNRFQDIISEEQFLEIIRSLRKKYGIPVAGYDWTPGSEIPPKLWTETGLYNLQELEGEMKKLATTYELHPMDWVETLLFFVFYTHIEMWVAPHSKDLCLVCDVVMDNVNPMPYEIQDMDNRAYPVAIRLSPYANERTIIDFVKRVYKSEIHPLQQLYARDKSKLTKSRTRVPKKRERDGFIYSLRHLSTEEIKKRTNAKFGGSLLVGYEEIRPIIRKEIKKRQEK